MLDSWKICQPSAWAFQTMPHNVLDSPEKQPGAWKLPAHHLNSLIWALCGSSVSLSHCLCASPSISLNISFSPLIHPPSSHFLSHTLSLESFLNSFVLSILHPQTHPQFYIFLLPRSTKAPFIHSFFPFPFLLRSSIL